MALSLRVTSPHLLINDIGRGRGSGATGQALDEFLHIFHLGHLHSVHLQNVRLADPKLDEGVLAVWANVRLFTRANHPMQLQLRHGPELQFAEVTRHRLLPVCL